MLVTSRATTKSGRKKRTFHVLLKVQVLTSVLLLLTVVAFSVLIVRMYVYVVEIR